MKALKRILNKFWLVMCVLILFNITNRAIQGRNESKKIEVIKK